MSELKPCPFCGYKATANKRTGSVRCSNCLATQGMYPTSDTAVKWWNTRATQWQPIETAPMDGRLAIVFRPLAEQSGDKRIAVKRMIGGNNFCWDRTVPQGATPTNPTDGACHATHWMPLPEPPEETK